MGIACNYQNYTDYCIGSILVGSQSATRLTATQIGNVMHEVWYLLISSTSQKSNVQITATMRNSAPFKGGCGSVSYFGVNQSTPSSNVSSGNSTAPQVEISLGSSLFHQTVFQSLGIDCGGSPTGSAFNFMSWLDRETFWDNYPDATACIESVGGDSIECSGDPSNYYNYTANAALNQSSNWVYVAVALIDPANADQTISGNLEVQGVLTIDGPKGNWIDMGVIQGMGGAPILQVNQSLMTKNDLVTYGFISSQTDPSKSSGGGAFCIGHGWVGSGAPPVALSGPLICLTDSGVPVQSGSGSFPSMTSGGIGSLFNRTDQHTLNIYTGSGNPPWNVAETTNFSGNYDTLFLVMNNLYTPANLDLGNLTAHGSIIAGNMTCAGNLTVNGSLSAESIGGTVAFPLYFQNCSGDCLVKGLRGGPALTNATMTRIWLEIDNASLMEGTTGPGASIQFVDNATEYWEIIDSVNCAASYIPASDSLAFWYDGPNPGSKFSIYGNGTIWTMNNKLDDGSGNMTVSGSVYSTSGHYVSLSSNSNMCFDGGSYANYYWRCNYSLPQLNNFTTTMTLTPWGDLYILGSYYSWSSQRNKTNIVTMPDASWIYNLRPVTFDWADAKRAAALGRTMGLIAEEVYSINPQLVKLDDDGQPEGINYGLLSVPILAELQKLRAEVEELKAKLTAA